MGKEKKKRKEKMQGRSMRMENRIMIMTTIVINKEKRIKMVKIVENKKIWKKKNMKKGREKGEEKRKGDRKWEKKKIIKRKRKWRANK